MRSSVRWFRILPAVVLAFACLSAVVPAACGEATVFELEEVSVFDLDQQQYAFTVGHAAACEDVPDANVAAYPTFKSKTPIYGSVLFTSEVGRGDAASGLRFFFALDESEGPGTGYDRLYFDRNRDLDLTNDPPLRKQASPPEGAIRNSASIGQQACFELITIPLPFGSEGARPLETMPRMTIYESGYKRLSLVTTKARKGRITLTDREYDVVLGHNYVTAGWFDHPMTALHLIPVDGSGRAVSWWDGDRLMAMHRVGEALYRFSATPAGNKLTVQPYDGPLGTFQLGAGGRDITEMTMSGSLLAKDVALAVGEVSDEGRSTSVASCRLPVGDYLPNYLTVTYGGLRISMSQNYHADGKPRGALSRDYVFGIKIREDKPFTFDFSNKPAVMFASPARDHRVKLGEELTVKAVLTDPVLNIMIRGLTDPSQTKTTEVKRSDGRVFQRARPLSLDPKVVITRADGEVVAEGVLPFG